LNRLVSVCVKAERTAVTRNGPVTQSACTTHPEGNAARSAIAWGTHTHAQQAPVARRSTSAAALPLTHAKTLYTPQRQHPLLQVVPCGRVYITTARSRKLRFNYTASVSPASQECQRTAVALTREAIAHVAHTTGGQPFLCALCLTHTARRGPQPVHHTGRAGRHMCTMEMQTSGHHTATAAANPKPLTIVVPWWCDPAMLRK
jgi:hypothetical protein